MKTFRLPDDAWMKFAYVLPVTLHFPNCRDQSQAQDNLNLNLQQE